MEPTNQPTPAPAERAPEQPGQELAKPELSPQAPAAEPAQAPVPATPVVPASAAPTTTGSEPAVAAPVSETPAVADDVDVIEKEWVDAAESVVKQHGDDPHAEEEGFENLQVDYLKKRYGKDIKKADE